MIHVIACTKHVFINENHCWSDIHVYIYCRFLIQRKELTFVENCEKQPSHVLKSRFYFFFPDVFEFYEIITKKKSVHDFIYSRN